MASYTKITNIEVKSILKTYGFEPGDIALTPLDNGISNSNYRLSFENRELLLKISNDKNGEELASEHNIINWLSTKNFPLVLAPLKTLNGSSIYNYLDYTGALFPFVKNEPYQKSLDTMEKLGRALAQLHSVSINEKELTTQAIRQYKTVGYGINQILNYLDRPSCPQDFKEAFNDIYPENKASHLTDLDLPGGIIHGDFYFDNALFFNDEISTILDFEQAGIGRFILDLGIAISGSAIEQGEITTPYLQAYLKGYQEVRPLSIQELELLNDAIIIGLFSISLWRIKRFTEGNIDSSKKDSYRELLTRALQFHQGL